MNADTFELTPPSTNGVAHKVAELPVIEERLPAQRPPAPQHRFQHYKCLEDSHGNPVSWLNPPIPGTAADPASGYGPLVDTAAGHLESQGLPFHGVYVRLAHGQALQACREYDELQADAARRLEAENDRRTAANDKLELEIAKKEEELAEAQQGLGQARERLKDALAPAGIVADPAELDLNLLRAEPEMAATAGEAAVLWGLPQPEKMPWLEKVMVFVIGIFLAICLGEVSGAMRLKSLEDMDTNWPRLLVFSLLGAGVVYGLGRFAVSAVHSLAYRILERSEGQPPQKLPLRWLVCLAVLLAVVFCLALACGAEVGLEAVALQMLNMEAVLQYARANGQEVKGGVEALSPALAALVGVTITACYVFFKLFGSWAQCEEAMRHNWLRHLSVKKLQERLSRLEWVEALKAAGDERCWRAIVATVERALAELRGRLLALLTDYDPATRLMLCSARMAAVGESARLRAEMEWLRDERELRDNKTWWERLFWQRPTRKPVARWKS